MRRALPTAAVLVFFLGPLAWQVLTSFWPEPELTRPIPHALTLANYAGLGGSFARAVLSSLLVAAGTTAVCLSVGASAAFAIAKLEFRGRSLLLGGALAISMFPPIATVSPLYLLLRAVGLRDTLATSAILVFIFSWNELLYALSFISTPAKRTIPVAIALFAGEHVEPWGQIAAASVVATVPLALLTLAFQRRIVAGLTAGAVKE